MAACIEKEMTKKKFVFLFFFLQKIQPFHFLCLSISHSKAVGLMTHLFVCCLCIYLLNGYVVFEASSTCDHVQQSRFSDAPSTLSRTFVLRDFLPTAPTLSTEC